MASPVMPLSIPLLLRQFARALSGALLVLAALAAHAGEVQVAVASNFTAPMQKIAAMFEQDTGHKAQVAYGSTGRFYAQVKNGAPFDVLLAADNETPQRLMEDSLAVKGMAFTYAKGKLVLWSAKPGVVDESGSVLRNGRFDKLAIADPKLAPYGLAAMEVLSTLKIAQVVEPKLVRGENISQAYQFVATGNAQIGLVALSQVSLDGKITQGSAWVMPGGYYTAILQDAVLLNKGLGNPAALALMDYLRTDKVRALIRTYGYDN
nr:molybdate ABC transporter substrate-binding protein [Caenimonas koreensis]